jgi:hydroxyacylglutathione hydrolase
VGGLSGDTLFAMGCGRLFEGRPEQMWKSLSKIKALPETTLVFCGHEYTASNAKFALSINPGNALLEARKAVVDELRAHVHPRVLHSLAYIHYITLCTGVVSLRACKAARPS